MELDRNGLVVLRREECLDLLGSSTLGRVAVTVGALPTILPVNFRLVDDQVVFRTGVGSKLDAATRGEVVAFEVDGIDPVEHTGWSVVVTGVVEECELHRWVDGIVVDAIPRWAPDGDTRVVALSTEIVSGRRIGRRHPPVSDHSLT